MVYDGTCSSLINLAAGPPGISLLWKSLICRQSLLLFLLPRYAQKPLFLSLLGFQGTLLFTFIADNKENAGLFFPPSPAEAQTGSPLL